MNTFFCKLVPPRPTFSQDVTEAEREIMREHAAYWQRCLEAGHVVAFGLVADPAGAFGMGIIEVADEDEARRLTAEDPAILSGRGFRYEIHPMPRGAIHPPHA